MVITPSRPCGIVTELFPEIDTFSEEREVPPEEDDELEEEPPLDDELEEELPEEDELEEEPPEEDDELEEEPPLDDEIEPEEELLLGSTVHVELHPSLLLVFPSSHCSAVCLVPSPQIGQVLNPKQLSGFVGQHPFIQQREPHCVYVQLGPSGSHH